MSAAMGFFSRGFKNEFETAVVIEPSVFEPLKFYCIFSLTSLLNTLIFFVVKYESEALARTAKASHIFQQKNWSTVKCLSFGTPKNIKISICSKCKIDYF